MMLFIIGLRARIYEAVNNFGISWLRAFGIVRHRSYSPKDLQNEAENPE